LKKILLTTFLVIALTLSFAAPAFAADPVVSIDVTSPGGGITDITVTGVDSSTWNPGSTGQTNNFRAEGAYTVSYDSYAGIFGKLSSYVNASSTTGAIFKMIDTHDFDILSANHNYGTVGTFTAEASGPTTVDMNIGSIGSMYVWSEANYPSWSPPLQGTFISKQYDMLTNNILTATVDVVAYATGGAVLSNSAQWGFGANENGTVRSSLSTTSLAASGAGTYTQYASASSNVVSNAAMNVDGTPVVVNTTLPAGGAASIVANFLNSFSANPYTVTAK